MNRIQNMFADLKQKGDKALITYITAGDPDHKTTDRLLHCLVESGADMIELGVPFSDPMADGPTIQQASQRALQHHFSMKTVFDHIRKLRVYSDIPVILFGYYNPFYQYGLQRLARESRSAGADGFLVVDLPPEEAGELKAAASEQGLDTIFLLAPTSTDERMACVSRMATGFIYYVSVTGVTGARESLATKMRTYVSRIRRHSRLPVGIGFGVSTPGQVRSISGYADAVIVGSAIIKLIEQKPVTAGLIPAVSSFVRSLKEATRS